jgi:hypothetical protein
MQRGDKAVEYSVKIECPWCGRRVGQVEKLAGEKPQMTLYGSLSPGQCAERGCGGLEWPSEDEVARAVARARRKPVRPGSPFGGQTATVRAHRVADFDPGDGMRGTAARRRVPGARHVGGWLLERP